MWEYRALKRDEEEEQDEDEEDDEYEEEEEEDFDEYEYSEGPGTPNGYHQESGGSGGIHRDALQNYVNTEQVGKRLSVITSCKCSTVALLHHAIAQVSCCRDPPGNFAVKISNFMGDMVYL